MSAKRKNRIEKQPATSTAAGRQRQAQPRVARVGSNMEDYIWSAMQSYAAEMRSGHKSGQRFV